MEMLYIYIYIYIYIYNFMMHGTMNLKFKCISLENVYFVDNV
jgi:hypothetical protein